MTIKQLNRWLRAEGGGYATVPGLNPHHRPRIIRVRQHENGKVVGATPDGTWYWIPSGTGLESAHNPHERAVA